MSRAPRRVSRHLWSALSPASPLERLGDTLATYRHDLDLLIQLTSTTRAPKDWAARALKLLDEADQAVRDRNPERGWRLFLAAQRVELHGRRALGAEAFRARAASIRAEALQKLGTWRRKQVEQLFASLSEADKNADVVSDAEFAVAHETAQLLHEHFTNDALKQRAARSQLRILVGIAAAALLVWWWCCARTVLGLPDDPAINEPSLVLSVLLFGLMGAAFSALTSSFAQSASQTIPDQAFNYRVTLARQAVGMLSALVAYVALASGSIRVAELTLKAPLYLILAFAAGFSERLVIGTLDRFASSTRNPRSP